jgi:hypothetical protein
MMDEPARDRSFGALSAGLIRAARAIVVDAKSCHLDRAGRVADQVVASPSMGHGRYARLRSPEEVGFAVDSPLEGAVTCELVSVSKFPVSRENTGNFIDSELSGASTRAKKAINSVPYEPIPYASEQGIFWGLAGN